MRFLIIFIIWLNFLNATEFHFAGYFDNKIKLEIDKNAYIYKDSLKVLANNQDVTNLVVISKSHKYQNYDVYFDLIEFDGLFLKQFGEIDIFYQGCSKDGLCYPPYIAKLTNDFDKFNLQYENKLVSKIDESKDFNQSGYDVYFDSGFVVVLVSFFLYGVLLSLTPCTLPLIPILSSILATKTKHKLVASVIYVFGMSLAYSVAGVLAALFGKNLNAFFQSDLVLIAFSVVFMLLSLSSFGFFSFKLPQKFQDTISLKSSSFMGNIGVFFMGVLSSLIVGPCVVAPLSGALLYIADTKDLALGGLSLFMLSFGMGIPLILIGFGFRFLKANDFMVYINRFFGFVLLGVANYFIARIFNYELYDYVSYAILCFIFSFSFQPFGSKKDLVSKAFCIITFISFGAFCLFSYKAYEVFSFSSDIGIRFQNVKEEDVFNKEISNGKTMVYFTASWCQSCKSLQKTTFSDNNVISALNEYKKIKIDISKSSIFTDNLMKRYGVFAPPVVLFFDNGKVISKKVGYQNPALFLEGIVLNK